VGEGGKKKKTLSSPGVSVTEDSLWFGTKPSREGWVKKKREKTHKNQATTGGP